MTKCAHQKCVDDAVVIVEFSEGQNQPYCEFHALHINELQTVEVKS